MKRSLLAFGFVPVSSESTAEKRAKTSYSSGTPEVPPPSRIGLTTKKQPNNKTNCFIVWLFFRCLFTML